MAKLGITDWRPKVPELRPEILCHPHIPKPLHGVNPRTIKGDDWWQKTRKEAIARTDGHCIACGVHVTQAKKHMWLECHEFWHIDYKTGLCEVTSIEPLCHYCHNFIHSGRLMMIEGTEKPAEEIIEILAHGLAIVREHKLAIFSFTADYAKSLGIDTKGVRTYTPRLGGHLSFKGFRLLFEGSIYTG